MDISKESIKINDLNISKQITKQNEEQKIESKLKNALNIHLINK